MVDEVEQACLDQVQAMIDHPAFTRPVAVMPDTHAGKGSVIGFTMPLAGKIIPSVVGVDIGCGMLATAIELDSPDLSAIDRAIKGNIPAGPLVHAQAQATGREYDELFARAGQTAKAFFARYNEQFGTNHQAVAYGMDWFEAKCAQVGMDLQRALLSLGSLGGGNHFIELGRSPKGKNSYWLTIHSGSRKLGETICHYHQRKAQDLISESIEKSWAAELEAIKKELAATPEAIGPAIQAAKEKHKQQTAPLQKGMEYLEGEVAADYFTDMIFVQQYASLNRRIMQRIILAEALGGATVQGEIESVHNYIDFQDLIIRKGAIRSYEGEQMVIPFNMRDGLLICRGRSNAGWNCSAPHGAGRLMSRGQARRQLSLEEMNREMKEAGVYTTSCAKGTLDEAAGAYKPAAMIEKAIRPTAEIIEKVKPVLNIKEAGNLYKSHQRKKKKKT